MDRSEDALALLHVLEQCGGECRFCTLEAGLDALEEIRGMHGHSCVILGPHEGLCVCACGVTTLNPLSEAWLL